MKTTPLLANYQTSITCPKNHSEYSENNSDVLIKTPHFRSITLTLRTQLRASERNSELQEHNSELQNETPDSRNTTPSFRTKLRTPGTQLRASERNSGLPENNSKLLECNSGISPKNSVHNSEPSKQLRHFDGTYSDRQNPIMKFPRTSQSVYNYVILLDLSCSVEVGIPLAHPLQSVD
jgi:hypothetical protein